MRPWSRRQLLLSLSALGGCVAAAQTTAPTLTSMSKAPSRCAIRGLRKNGDAVEVEVESAQGFPVQNELATLRLGSAESRQSRYAEDGDLRILIFSFSAAEFAAVPDGAPALVYYGELEDTRRFDCGRIDKRQLAPT